ncbi:MAG TPA: hypothetical protein DCG19_13115 [Cryomorphaceae bacterium]|nr:hypothetical protein [Owenweeksia sp.]MBF98763.1 hypothetical protein [Owenweeksia sp.]HAD98344.1 hypothetical protein [Cryomorphaceae bacterium]HBF21451.1 hypothetical protein [Cryomorphaceae bacterium]HCQ17590.1 hypothetical protein [Cryomorphaceae bacterium]|tara:strand:- start:437 stop:1000 length:564 start_codon:yes stop_codon:yes gene_type:complete
MKKLLFSMILGAGLIGCGTLSAQQSNLGINLATALPMGDAGDGYDFGVGGGLSFDYYFNQQFDLGVEVQFINMPLKETDVSLAVIPIQLTGAYHADLTDILEFYGELGAGFFLLNLSAGELEDPGYFGASPRLGLAMDLTDRLFLDFNVNYTFIASEVEADASIDNFSASNLTYLGFNLGLLYTVGD